MKLTQVVIGSVLLLLACKKTVTSTVFEPIPVKKLNLTEAELYNKVLGNLVGSAIGDAMGAPTEMWRREDIQLEYGYVDGLDTMVREASAEGPWKFNLPAGGTTDDTRWKEITYEYLTIQSNKKLTASSFAQHLIDRYQSYLNGYASIKSFDPEPFESNTMKVAWLQEWAKVAKPYTEGKINEFQKALSTFYGGEMVCAGLLFAPAIGAFYPGDPEAAYQNLYEIDIYDLGYARDLSGLAAAMTATAMEKNSQTKNMLETARRLDPQNYFKSRLVGRTAYRIWRNAMYISQQAKLDTLHSLQAAYKGLDQHLEVMPFHAAEIYLQVLTAMIYSDFDFQKTLEFLINYGRDNDTTGAIAGGILGAYVGYDRLPADKLKVLHINKTQLNIDLEKLAQALTTRIIELHE